MSHLELDPTSARTLPHLDRLYLEGNTGKLADLLVATPPDVLRRLTLAAISRNTVPAGGPPANVEGARLLEKLIILNREEKLETISALLDVTEKGAIWVLVASIARYNAYDALMGAE